VVVAQQDQATPEAVAVAGRGLALLPLCSRQVGRRHIAFRPVGLRLLPVATRGLPARHSPAQRPARKVVAREETMVAGAYQEALAHHATGARLAAAH